MGCGCVLSAINTKTRKKKWYNFPNIEYGRREMEGARRYFPHYQFELIEDPAKVEIVSYLKMLSRSQEGGFFNLAAMQLENLELVDVVSYKEDIKLREMIEGEYLSRFYPNDGECYANAFDICANCPDVDYVEGYLLIGDNPLPIRHAFNEFRGIYLDLTAELKSEWRGRAYGKVIMLTAEQLGRWALRTGDKGNLFDWQFSSKLLSSGILEESAIMGDLRRFLKPEKECNEFQKQLHRELIEKLNMDFCKKNLQIGKKMNCSQKRIGKMSKCLNIDSEI